MPPPESRWSRPPVQEGESERVYYATSDGGVFYFRDLSEAQKDGWCVTNLPNPNEKEIANELRSKER